MKSRRKHGFQFMTILYFMIVFSMCVSRFNVIMTIMGGQLTRVEEINLLPFHSVRENLQYGRNPISWDMLYNMVMFVPFGIIYCYYQKHFRVYKAVGMSCLTTFFIESAQFILKTGVVDAISLASLNEAQTIEKIRSYVKNHIPVACHAVGSGSRQHWFVAYELTGESGGTWATAGIKVLDPYNSNSGSTEGRRVTILEAMQTSHVTLGVDRIRIPN